MVRTQKNTREPRQRFKKCVIQRKSEKEKKIERSGTKPVSDEIPFDIDPTVFEVSTGLIDDMWLNALPLYRTFVDLTFPLFSLLDKKCRTTAAARR